MKISKMSTEDLRAAIALHKSNRFSKYYKDLCAELCARVNRNYFFGLNETVKFRIRDYNWLLQRTVELHKAHRKIANPELI